MERIPKATIGEISKSPVAWALMILGILVGTVMQQWIKTSDRVNINCERENTRLRDELKGKNDQIINLYDYIINDRKKTKGLINQSVGEKSKEIVENGMDTNK